MPYGNSRPAGRSTHRWHSDLDLQLSSPHSVEVAVDFSEESCSFLFLLGTACRRSMPGAVDADEENAN